MISDRHNPRPTTGKSHSFPNLSQQLTGPAVVVLVEVVVDEVVDVEVVVGAGVVVVGACVVVGGGSSSQHAHLETSAE